MTYSNDLIPTMTSNTTPSGVASASTEYSSSYRAWKAMDDTNADAFCWHSAKAMPAWLQYQFTSGKIIQRYTITSRNIVVTAQFYPIAFTLRGSNNGSDWTVLDTQTGQVFGQNIKKTYDISNLTSYTYYRLNITQTSDAGTYAAIGEWELMTLLSIQKTIQSDAKIKIFNIQKELTSDAKIIVRHQEEINSDATIKITDIPKTIQSDSKIKAIGIQEEINSDATVTGSIRKDILSDSKIKTIDNQKNVDSNAIIKIFNIQKTITSDGKIFAPPYYSKFIHNSDAFVITDTNPAQIIKIDLDNPALYTIYTLTGKLNAKDLIINHDREYLYLSLNNGYVIKTNLNNLLDTESFYVGENVQLYSISHNEEYLTTFVADAIAGESLFAIDETVNIKINTDIRTRKEASKQIKTFINTQFGMKINTDIRTQKGTNLKINTDLRFNKYEYNEISLNPLGREDFHIFIDKVESIDVDQSIYEDGYFLQLPTERQKIGQTFKINLSGNISQIKMMMNLIDSEPCNYIFEIQETTAGIPNGMVLGSITKPSTFFNISGIYEYTIRFNTLIPVIIENTYAIVIYSDEEPGSHRMRIYGTEFNTYTDGQALGYFNSAWHVEGSMMSDYYFKIYIISGELGDDDLKLDSIKITHTIDAKSTAQFTLFRKHDDIDNPTEISDNNVVTIYMGNRLEFTGKIQKLDCGSSEETITVYAESDTIIADYSIVTKELPLTILNEQVHLYDILLDDISIDNSFVDDRLIIVGKNGKYWGGGIWQSKLGLATTFNTFALAQNYINSVISNHYFTRQEPNVENYEQSPKYYRGIRSKLGTAITERVIGYDVYMGVQNLVRNAEQIEDGTFEFIPNFTYFWVVHVILYPMPWFGSAEMEMDNAYIGTSLASLNGDLYEIIDARYTYQLVLNDIEHDLGEYTIGTAPYKEVSTKNGAKETKPRWVDKEDGKYTEQGISYNYTNYVNQVANIEYQKLKNINGQISPITSANLSLTVDAYLYYRLKLLTKINIVNTSQPNIYKNDNGFPVSIKTIDINSSDMKISLSCDNQKSEYELQILDGFYPDEPKEVSGFSKKIHDKFDLATWEKVQYEEEEKYSGGGY